jgi:SpoVK/Ycf46/Vps4 family AAA+-type ATPase
MVLVFQYVGESERNVRVLFQRAQDSAPSVIFFDEIEALCPKRNGEKGEVSTEARSVSLVSLVTYLILASINRFHQSQYHKTRSIKVS